MRNKKGNKKVSDPGPVPLAEYNNNTILSLPCHQSNDIIETQILNQASPTRPSPNNL